MMALSSNIAKHLPFMRRYARAVSGSQEAGDRIVLSLLEAVAEDDILRASLDGTRVAIYSAFTKVLANTTRVSDAANTSDSHEAAANKRLSLFTPLNRQALLLTTLEEFSVAEAAEILTLSADEVSQMVEDAISEIERETATNVLIIEDEPLISMQLEDLVRSLGHEICGAAATRTQALEVVEESRPGLVLADIQLADGSSGLDAVDDIMAIVKVPVIFITAYPERLLTGDSKEPTYLISKPFKERAVRAAISQALFFESSQPVA
jgi:CheY-like chemotaxis protein